MRINAVHVLLSVLRDQSTWASHPKEIKLNTTDLLSVVYLKSNAAEKQQIIDALIAKGVHGKDITAIMDMHDASSNEDHPSKSVLMSAKLSDVFNKLEAQTAGRTWEGRQGVETIFGPTRNENSATFGVPIPEKFIASEDDMNKSLNNAEEIFRYAIPPALIPPQYAEPTQATQLEIPSRIIYISIGVLILTLVTILF